MVVQQIIFKSSSLSYSNAEVQINFYKAKKSETLPPPKISWYVGDTLLWKSFDKLNFNSLVWNTPRTDFISNGSITLKMPEHLAPVFLLWPDVSFDVRVKKETPELPLLDGSAKPYFEVLRKDVGRPQEILFYDIQEAFSFEFVNGSGNGFCSVRPSDTFEVEYSMSREFSSAVNLKNSTFQKYQDSCYVSIYDADDLLSILSARTFIFEQEWAPLRNQGLLQHVSNSSGLLLSFDSDSKLKTLNSTNLRFENEPIRHKVLDLIGDLTLVAPELPRARIRIHNGGHASHRLLFQRLVPYVHFRHPSQIR